MKATLRLMTTITLVASACTIMDGNAIVTGTARDAISPEQVRLYRTPPARFEEVAIINASAGHDFRKSSGLMNSAIQRLKEEAARVGANGVLLSEIDERDAPVVSTTYGSATASGGRSSVSALGNSTSVNRGDSHTRLRGIAIYVP
jgi:hypothetical protein